MKTKKIFFALLISFALPSSSQSCKTTICSWHETMKILKSKLDAGQNPKQLAQKLQQELDELEQKKESREFEAIEYGRQLSRNSHPKASTKLIRELHEYCLEKNQNCENLTTFAAFLIFGKDWEHLENTLKNIFESQKSN